MSTFDAKQAWVDFIKDEMDTATTWQEVSELYKNKESKMQELLESYEKDGIIVTEWLDKL